MRANKYVWVRSLSNLYGYLPKSLCNMNMKFLAVNPATPFRSGSGAVQDSYPT